MSFRYWFIKKIYGDHNNSRAVKQALSNLFNRMPEGFKGLNVGAGHTKLHPNLLNLEIEAGDGIDIVGSIEAVPAEDNSFDLLIAQEVLEHVPNLPKALSEIHRILAPGGVAYLQMPFTIGYHPCPHDYWRFSHEGMAQLAVQADLHIEEIAITVGPAVGFYRILVEFWAVLLSAIWQKLYMPTKALGALVFYPLKWLDPLMMRSSEKDRIVGGYYLICRKDA